MFRFTKKEERGLHDAFEIGVWLKGLDGLAELIGGFLLFFVSSQTIQSVFLFLASHELAEDPRDLVAGSLLHFLSGFTAGAQSFYSWLFMIHGAVKVFIVAGLLKNKLWAYPAAIAAFSLFIVYQTYQIGFNHSLLLGLITFVDVLVVVLTVHEYRHALKKKSAVGASEFIPKV